MRMDVLAGDVGNILLVPIGQLIQDQASLLSLCSAAEGFRSQEQSQLEGHVEPGQMVCPVKLSSRNIVNAQLALPHDFVKLFYARLSRILCLLGASNQVS